MYSTDTSLPIRATLPSKGDGIYAQVKRKMKTRPGSTRTLLKHMVNLHDYGYAHSFEAWHGDQLVGGLYGVGIEKCSLVRSMFSILPNASKAAFIQAVRFLSLNEFKIIDCQVYTDHLSSLGAIPVDRHAFYDLLVTHVCPPSLNGIHWSELLPN